MNLVQDSPANHQITHIILLPTWAITHQAIPDREVLDPPNQL
jgi:hypothetical protein